MSDRPEPQVPIPHEKPIDSEMDRSPRAGWAEAGATLADEPVDTDWKSFGNEDDAALAW